MPFNPDKLTINGDGRPRFVVVKPQKMFESKGGEVYTPTTLRGYVGKAIDLDGSSEYCSKAAPVNCDMNGAERITASSARDFEVNLGGWSSGGNHTGAARVTTDAHSGSACMECSPSGAGGASNNVYGSSIATALEIGKKYTLEVWAKSVSGDTSLTIKTFISTFVDGQALGTVTLTGSWAKYSFSFLVAA